jgi:peroxiredoxin
MTLQEQIEAQQQRILSYIPERIRRTLAESTSRLVRSGIHERCLAKDDRIPAFTLMNLTGGRITSDSLLRRGRLVISFYLGSWSPPCCLEMQVLQEHLADLRALGAQLVAVSPELPDNSLAIKEKYGVEFDLLHDAGNAVARRFGLVFAVPEEVRAFYANFGFHIPSHNGEDTWEIPLPATYIVETDQTVLHAYADADYTKRMEPAEIVSVLRAHSRG